MLFSVIRHKSSYTW